VTINARNDALRSRGSRAGLLLHQITLTQILAIPECDRFFPPPPPPPLPFTEPPGWRCLIALGNGGSPREERKRKKKEKKKKGNAVGEEQRHFSVRLRFRSVVNAAIFCFRLAIRSEICPLERMEHCHYRVRIFSFLSADFVIRPIETLTDSRALPRTTRGYDLCWILNVPIHRESYQRYYD